MDLKNHTDYEAAYSTGILKSAQYCVVVVIKATYDIHPDRKPTLAEKQTEIFDADAFTGEPGYSSPLYDNDYATIKPQCDVVLQNAIAYVPDGKPATEVEVSLQIPGIDKHFRVLGKRVWEKSGFWAYATKPEPFTTQPITWEIAYGGVDETAYEEEDLSDTYLVNPVGIGYWRKPKAKITDGTPIAHTETIDTPITDPKERHIPQGFGVVGRNWLPRSQYGGTYDEAWERNRRPFLPDDFDEHYYQSAPSDQQIEYPQGGEQIKLVNLTPEGELAFELPADIKAVPIEVSLTRGGSQRLESMIDTITIDTANKKLTMVARAHIPFVHSIHEIGDIKVGTQPEPKDVLAEEAAAKEAK